MTEILVVFQIDDLVIKILGHISDGTTYKSARLVSRNWLVAAGNRLEEFINIPFTLWTYQDKLGINIDIADILSNPNTSLTNIEELISLGFITKGYYSKLSENPNLTWNFIQAHPQIKWNYYILSKYPVITWEIVNKYGFIAKSKVNPSAEELAAMDKLELKQYKKEQKMRTRGKIEWYMKRLMQNPNIPLQKLEIQYEKKFADYFEYIFSNPQITLEKVEEYIKNGVSVDFRKLSKNPNLTQKFIEKYINENWNWEDITLHPVITIEFIIKHINKEWEWWELSLNPSIPTNWTYLKEIQNHNSFISYIIKTCMSPNYTMTDTLAESNPNYVLLSQNPNLTWKFIIDHKDCDWDWVALASNKFRKNLVSYARPTILAREKWDKN